MSWNAGRSRNVSYDGVTLVTTDILWQNCCVFEVHSTELLITVKIPTTRSFGIDLGIARKEASTEAIMKSPGISEEVGYSLICTDIGDKWSTREDTVQLRARIQSLPSMAPNQTIRMHYIPSSNNSSSPQLFIGVDDGHLIKIDCFQKPIRVGDYLPYLRVRGKHSVPLSLSSNPRKRKRADDHVRIHAMRMWEERRFTDAQIKTTTGSIKVHRAILCAFPVFEAAFAGVYQESTTCTIQIDDASHGSVEALVQFLYTAELPDTVDYCDLLKLAHRYEEQELVNICARAIVDAANEANVCETVRAMRLFKDHPCVADQWKRLKQNISQSGEMQESVMMAL